MPQARRARRADKASESKTPAPGRARIGLVRQARRPRWIVPLAAVGVCALVLIAYGNSVSNGFVWDDNRQVVMNPDLRAGAPWSPLFASDVWGFEHEGRAAQTNYYRPLQMVTYRLTATAFGFNAPWFHLVSLLFALATVAAAWWVFFQLTRQQAIAGIAAALFALHPVHTEAVDWISALPELGCALFVLMALGLFLSARGPGRGGTRLLWASSLVAFAAALLWKETALVFPLLVAAYAVCLESGTLRERFRLAAKLSLPYWCTLAAYLIVRLRALGFVAMKQRIWELSGVQVVLSDLHLMTMYWEKLIAPVELNAYHLFVPVRAISDLRAIAAIVFAILLLAAIVYGLKRHRLAAFATLWVCITLLPVMNIYALGRNVFAERYLYLPSVGWCLLASLAIAAAMAKMPAKARRPVWAALLLVVVGWYAAGTYVRNPDWKDDATLFRRTLAHSPEAPYVHFMVGATEDRDPDGLQSAEGHYLRAIALAERENPPDWLDVARSYGGLASLYSDRGDYERALQMVREWRQVNPSDPGLDAEEGLILLKAGRWQQGEPLLQRAFAARPNDENVLNALGLLTWQYERNLPKAAELFRRALEVHTAKDDFRASLHNNLGAVYGDLEQFPAAAEQLQAAVRIAPADPQYHTNLASALAAMGRYAEARAELESALRINPNYPPARAVLQQLQTR